MELHHFSELGFYYLYTFICKNLCIQRLRKDDIQLFSEYLDYINIPYFQSYSKLKLLKSYKLHVTLLMEAIFILEYLTCF